MPAAYHMVNYRRFDAGETDLSESTLESLCRSALDSTSSDKLSLWQRPSDRIFLLDGDDGRQVFLNEVADLSSAVFGILCLAQSTDLQTLLDLKPTAVQLSSITTAVVFDLNERTAPDGSQFIRGLAYWMVIGNHVFFVKKHAMTVDLLHSYLNWLLKIRTETVSESLEFTLQAAIDKSQGAGDIGDVTSFHVSGKSAPRTIVSAEGEGGVVRERRISKRIAERVAEMSQAIPIVRALLGPPRTASLVESLGPDEYLAVEATIKVRGRRTEQSKVQFQKIANDLAEMPDATVKIEGKDGRLSDGDAIIRTKMPFNIPYEGSNILEFDNVADQIQEVYRRFIQDGKISG